MKITILDVAKVNGGYFVSFKSGAGQGIAKWMNEKNPVASHSYDVELDTDKTISDVSKDASNQTPENALTIDGDKVLMFGILESIEDDGMAYLRLSPDGLVMIEVGDDSLSEGESMLLEIERSDLEVTAQGL